jgi:septal ring factor EnvC (AmiA/AmiB activator)
MASFGTPPYFNAHETAVAPLPPSKERVDVVLEGVFQKVDLVGNQLCAFAAELEELKAEVANSNSFLDRELRTQLQQANDEIYRLRNQLSEYTDRKK